MPSPRELPMAKLAIALIMGILIGSFLDLPMNVLFIAFGVSFMALLFFHSLRRLGLIHLIRSGVLYLNIILIGVIIFQNAEKGVTNTWIDNCYSVNQMAITCQSIPKEGKSTRILAKVTHIQKESDLLGAISPVYAYINIYDQKDKIRVGDQMIVMAKLTHPIKAKNPLAFDYANYLKFQGVGYQAFMNSKDILKTTYVPSTLNYINGHMREYALNLFQNHLTGDNLAIASALVLGYRDLIDDELDSAFADTGSTHVLAVSGLHVGIVSFGIGLLLLLLPTHNMYWKVLQIVILIAGIALFAILTGGSPSVIRASVMFGALQVSKIITGKYCVYNAIGASAFVMLLWDPFYLFQVSFQLSYAAILSIIFFYPKIHGLIAIENTIGDKIWRMTVIAISVQVLTMPIAVYYFHQFPMTFLISGITAVGLASVILGVGLIGIVLSAVMDVSFVFKIFDGLISCLVKSTYMIDELPYSLIQNIHLDKIGFVLLLLTMVSLGIYGLHANRKFALAGLSFLFLLTGYTTFDKYVKLNKSEIIVYNAKHTLVDVISNGTCYTYADENLKDQSVNYATENYRRANRVYKIVELNSEADLFKMLEDNKSVLDKIEINNYDNNEDIDNISGLVSFVQEQKRSKLAAKKY